MTAQTPARLVGYRIEFPVIETKFDLSRSDAENLLVGFLTGAIGVELRERLGTSELPAECREQVRVAEVSGRLSTAWSTERGPMAAWGDFHAEPSKRLYAYLLFVEWWDARSGHHALWSYCDPKRSNEWTIGRGL